MEPKKTTDGSGDLSDFVTVETNDDAVDSPIVEEGNPVETPKEPEASVEDSEQGQPVDEVKTLTQDEIASSISKATENTFKKLEVIAGLLKDNPEKLAELEKSDPKLFDKLKKRNPNMFNTVVLPTEEKTFKADVVLKEYLELQEKNTFNAWRKENKISDADYKVYGPKFEETAKALLDEGYVKGFGQALKVSGGIAFPHLDGKPVDNEQLNKMQGQSPKTSILTPANTGYDENDIRIMKKTGLSEKQFNKVNDVEILPPGI